MRRDRAVAVATVRPFGGPLQAHRRSRPGEGFVAPRSCDPIPVTKKPPVGRLFPGITQRLPQGSKSFAKITSLTAVIVKFGAEMLKKMLPTQETRTRAWVVETLGTVMFALPLFGNVPAFCG